MPILPAVGKKSPQMRLLVVVIYTILIAGSVTMAYPFLIMLSGSVKGNADIGALDAVPEEFNSKYDCAFSTWNDFSGALDTPLTKEFFYDKSSLVNRYLEFKRSRPLSEKAVLNIDGYYFNIQKGFEQVTSGEMKPVGILTSTCPKGPQKALWAEFVKHHLNVVQYIAVYGRAIFNTVVFIGLTILAALTVNPLAAYALSRFNLKGTYSILMFFMATMAFPGAVTMIPNFILLKELHLLNSFWALVLPGVANSYAIFILKGFFDSIPKEVYESAMMDGAGEWTLFWRFTMALSKPILALTTLGAFTSAYTAFMFALIICPDEKMWTLVVWLYQLQQECHQSVIYAALVLAAIPTLLVFVLAQNTIMRGIVIPVEK